MARKRKFHFLTDPIVKAAAVVESFVGKAKAQVGAWSRAYEGNIRAYTGDERRQQWAALKLTGFYEGIMDPAVRSEIAAAVSKAKERQRTVVAAALPRAPVPTVPPEVHATARKVAEIIGAPAPATPPVKV